MNALVLAALVLGASADAGFEVRVDARVELVTSVFRLAGGDEFNMGVSRSPYSDRFDRRFAAFADHAAVRMAKELRRDLGISFNAPASLAVHLTDLPELGERVPFDLPPARLDGRWTPESAREFTVLLRGFAEESDFAAWFREHEEFHAAVEDRLRSFLEPRLHAEWFPRFFGGAPKGSCVIIPSLLQGGHNYGCSVRLGDGTEQLTPCIGLWEWDDEGLPVFDDVALGVVAHELAHAWVNPIVDAHADRLDPPGERIFPAVRGGLRNRAYSTWRIVTYESIVRATVVRWRLAHEGVGAARAQAVDDDARGFPWVARLVERLAEYEDDRETFATLSDFVPELAATFEELAERTEFVAAPRVVSVSPADGATDVAPGAGTLRVEFDRPMGPAISMMIVSGVDFPKLAGPPAWDATGRVLTVPVTFGADHNYGYSLNSQGGGNFTSREGARLEPVVVEFRTRRE